MAPCVRVPTAVITFLVIEFVWTHSAASSSTCSSPDGVCDAVKGSAMLQTRQKRSTLNATKLEEELLDVPYANDAPVQKIDFQWPSTTMPAAGWETVVVVHGRGGSKEAMYWLCRKIVKQAGRACAAMGRRSSKQRADTEAAIAFIFDNSAEYRIDPDRVALYGYSAGGFLVNNIVWQDEELRTKLYAVIIVNGALRVHVDQATASTGPFPPYLGMSCTNDNLVPYKWTKNMYDALRGKPATAALFTGETQGHVTTREVGFIETIETFLNKPRSFSITAGDTMPPELFQSQM